MPEALEKIPLFTGLHLEQLLIIKKILQLRHFVKGEKIIQQNVIGQGMYIIQSGSALVSVTLPGNVNVTLATLSINDFFGEITLIDKAPCSATVTARENLSCYFLTHEQYQMLQFFAPTIFYKINYTLTRLAIIRIHKIIQNVAGTLNEVPWFNIPTHYPRFIRNKIDNSFLAKHYDYLIQFECFAGFNYRELKILLQTMHSTTIAKGKTLFIQGQPSKELFIVFEGALQLVSTKRNRTSKIGVYGPGSFVGHSMVFDSEPRLISCISREDSTLLILSNEKLQQLQQQHPKYYHLLQIAISRSLVNRLRDANKLLIRINSQNTRISLASYHRG